MAMSRKDAGLLSFDIRVHGERALRESGTQDELQLITGLSRPRAHRLHMWATERRAASAALSVPAHHGRKHLVIGDTHAKVGESNRRFKWLGAMAADHQPDEVIQLGDWYDLPSECKPAAFRERIRTTLKDDIEVGHDAIHQYHLGLGSKTTGNMRHTITEGNHDWRVKKKSENEPWMEGLVEIGAAHKEAGWNWKPFLEPARIDGIAYQHYVCGDNGRPIAGVYQARNSLIKTEFVESLVMGHSHVYQRYEAVSRGVQSIVAGCCFEHDEEYAGRSNQRWWRGAFIFNEVRDGRFAVEEWPLDRIKRRYGV